MYFRNIQQSISQLIRVIVLSTTYILINITIGLGQELLPQTNDIRLDDIIPRKTNIYSPAIAVNNTNQIMAVWIGETEYLQPRVYGRIVDYPDKFQNSEFKIDPSNQDANIISRNVDIAPDENGNFVVVWEDTRFARDSKIYGRIFDAQGKSIIDKTILVGEDELLPVYATSPAIAINKKNTIQIAWVDSSKRVMTRMIEINKKTGQLELGKIERVDQNTRLTPSAFDPNITAAPGGEFVITWVDNRYEFAANQGTPLVFARQYNASGNPLHDDFQVNSFLPQVTTPCSAPDVVVDKKGNTMVFCWNDGRNSAGQGNSSIYSRTFSWSQKPESNDFFITSCMLNARPSLAIDFQNNITFIYSQTSQSQTDPQAALDHIFARSYKMGYEILGQTVQLDQGNAVDRDTQLKSFMTNSGEIFTAWTQNTIEDATGRIFFNSYAILRPVSPQFLTASDTGLNFIKWEWKYDGEKKIKFHFKNKADSIISPALSEKETTWLEENLTPNTLVTRTISAVFDDGAESLPSDEVSLFTMAEPPDSLEAIPIAGKGVLLKWKGNHVSRFAIERAPETEGLLGSWEFIVQWDDSLVDIQFQDSTTLPLMSYWYRVRGYNGDSVLTTAKSPLRVVTLDAPLLPPTEFHGLSQNDSTIIWRWQDNSTNEIGFQLEDSTGTALSVQLPENTTEYIEAGLKPNSRYVRRIRALSRQQEPVVSNLDTIVTLASQVDTIYLAERRSTALRFAWQSKNASAFLILRNSDLQRAPVAWDTLMAWRDQYKFTEFVDDSLEANERYTYSIQSYNQIGNINPDSSFVQFATLASPPSRVAVIETTTTAIKLRWEAEKRTAFRIRRAEDQSGRPGPYQIIKDWTDQFRETELDEQSLQPNTLYWYLIQSFNLSGEINPDSLSVQIATLALPVEKMEVMDVTSTTLKLSWTAPAASAFLIQRAFDVNGAPGTWKIIKDWNHQYKNTEIDDSNLLPNRTYWYRVQSYNPLGIISPSNTLISVKTQAVAHPTEFVGNAITTTEIYWQWQDNSTEEQGYQILTADSQAISPILPANTTSWRETDLKPNQQYIRLVKLIHPQGIVISSSLLDSVYTLTLPPGNLIVLDSTSTSITMSWDGNNGTRFMAERAQPSIIPELDWVPLQQNWADYLKENRFIDTGLIPNSTYLYRVVGFNGDQIPSTYSEIIQVSTPASILAPPTQLIGQVTSSTEISWTWLDNAPNESAYILKDENRNTISGKLQQNTQTWNEMNLKPNQRYTRQVFALNEADQESGGSNAVSLYTFALPPENLVAQRINKIVYLTWKGSGSSYYEIERALSPSAAPERWFKIATQVLDTTYQDTPPELMQNYWYRIYAFNGDSIRTASSNVDSITGLRIKGDLNYDYVISIADLSLLINLVLEKQLPTSDQEKEIANVFDQDENIDINDIVALLDNIFQNNSQFLKSGNESLSGPELVFETAQAPSTLIFRLNLGAISKFQVLAFEIPAADGTDITAELYNPTQFSDVQLSSKIVDEKLRIILYRLKSPLEAVDINPDIKLSIKSPVDFELKLQSVQIIDIANKPTCYDISHGQIDLTFNKFMIDTPILWQNYPNPFNSQTEFHFYCGSTPKTVNLKIYNLAG
ncbi:hypothetical protein JW964_19485, partial [candidate division KSB1 bacterium]|nr:hypothetical protein [candidate division KSB1 bacterium]